MEQPNSVKTEIPVQFKLTNKLKIGSGKIADRSYYVVPAVMMVEGAYTPHVDKRTEVQTLFFSSSELNKSVNTWNGRPVAINHPLGFSSCNSPEVLDRQWVGYIYNARYESQRGRLEAEMWLDKDRSSILMDRIEKGDEIDVSIGAFGEFDDKAGYFNNSMYDGSFTNIVGDHLAILPNSEGACNWQDGCGIRMKKMETTEKCCDEKEEKAVKLISPKEVSVTSDEVKKWATLKGIVDNTITESTKQKEPVAMVNMEGVPSLESFVSGAPKEYKQVLVDALAIREAAIEKEREKKAEVVQAVLDYAKSHEINMCRNFLNGSKLKDVESIAKVIASTQVVEEEPVNYDYSIQAASSNSGKTYCPAPVIDWN